MNRQILENKVRKFILIIYKFKFIIIVEDHIKLYTEPKFDEDRNLIKDVLSEDEKNIRLQRSLNNDVLITNCGVPFIFVINKSDNPCSKYDDKAEYILKHIRKLAISYGATIIYTSTKKKYNIKVLYDYIFHSLYNFDLIHSLNLIDKTSFFIPSGYDRFSVLKSSDTQHDLDYDYYDIIKNEERVKENNQKEQEIECEKVSEFLKKIKEKIYKSRGSIIKDELKLKKKEEEENIKKIEDNPPEKINKFDVFRKRPEGEQEKPTLSKEERAKKTRENIMHKLNLKKSKLAEASNNKK